MTDEQIKQNAKAYADNAMKVPAYTRAYDSFIAGAHSRDEEIKELKEEIESLQEQYNTCFDGFKKRGTKLGELMKENVKLRNPWISVEERPKKTDVYYVRTRQGCADMAYFDSSIEKWEKGRFTDGTVTNWMPIPEIPKGGEG